ncbi:MAG: glutamyl-tRNA reductase, partial [Thermomicrobia bacterium]|nr:glutamyl-tRNA reductase [Thermomicrobia bacterium]
MHLIAAGLNAGSAPLALRERLAFSSATLADGLTRLCALTREANFALTEGMILSTCHRLECYAVAHDADAGREALLRFLRDAHGVPVGEFMPHLVFRRDQDVVDHCFALAAGLASPVLGDSQILGQVSEAYAAAQAAGTAGPILAALVQRAMHAAKRVHSEMTLNRRVSVGYTAAAIALRAVTVPQPTALILGAGQMGQRAAWYLHKHHAGRILVANRTPERAHDLAARVNGEVVSWEVYTDAFALADIVIAATAAPNAVVRAEAVAAAMKRRPDRPLVCVDLAVPRDIEPAVADLPQVRVSTVDDLTTLVDADQAKRAADIPRAEAILAEGKADFARWQAARAVTPLIIAMRDEAERIRTTELHRFLQHDGNDLADAARLDALTKAIVNKLLHHPTVRLKEMSASPEHLDYAAVAGDLFGVSEANQEIG